jgi:hypothetical protein
LLVRGTWPREHARAQQAPSTVHSESVSSATWAQHAEMSAQ